MVPNVGTARFFRVFTLPLSFICVNLHLKSEKESSLYVKVKQKWKGEDGGQTDGERRGGKGSEKEGEKEK